MDTRPITPARLAQSVIAVPPLARDRNLKIDEAENQKLVKHIEAGGVSTLLYGGNAVLYHMRLSENARLLQMLVDIVAEQTLVIPSVGPSFGLMMDQADILCDFDFPTAMILPQKEVADPQGIASGIRRFVEAFGKPIVLYLKHDRWLPPELVGKLYQNGLVNWIKYAVVRDDPSQDGYLRELLVHVPSEIVVSGIGEQPAIVHVRDFECASYTSGCVCVNPARSQQMLRSIQAADYQQAEAIRSQFQRLEDLRNSIQPIRVLHRAVELSEIAITGPMLPMLGELTAEQTSDVATAAMELLKIG